jgi:hypothetical protein
VICLYENNITTKYFATFELNLSGKALNPAVREKRFEKHALMDEA